jgi:hypothetical protein
MSHASIKTICFLFICLFVHQSLLAHNGSVAYAYPIGKIKVDGNFSDWPANMVKYPIAANLSEGKPKDGADFSGFFQIGYRLDNHSLYVAFTITDDTFIQDTTENVRWNTQDGLELSIDARHLLAGSGVASFMYSQKLRNTNNAFYDPFAKSATWDIMEVALVTRALPVTMSGVSCWATSLLLANRSVSIFMFLIRMKTEVSPGRHGVGATGNT